MQLYKDADKKWRWRVRSRNNRVTASSGESFRTKWSAKRAAKRQFPDLNIQEL